MTPRDVVREFWDAMATNDFHAASLWLTEDFRLDWPQSGEIIQGRSAFAEINTAYPAKGLWQFDVRSTIADGQIVVTEVGVTDGVLHATALTFHTVRGDLISHQREFWPEPYDPPQWRAAWVTTSG
ncbi:MAG: nuclear transport factor 2 family protein [Pseudomonadota bacterium]